jgi:hypothetical protein
MPDRSKYLRGPFRSDEPRENVKPRRRRVQRPPIDFRSNQREIVAYFEDRVARLQIEKTTTTPRGQTLDWVPIESQFPRREIAGPPPPVSVEKGSRRYAESLAICELERKGVERGPKGTVPILRKKLDALGFTKPLKKYLSKSFGHRMMQLGGMTLPAPEEDGNHRYGYHGQSVLCFGGQGQFSVFDPYTESSDDFSLIQIGLSNSDLGFKQTVEAGWIEYQDKMGDWVPHLFIYYTTNGYTDDDDNKGGWNTEVDGWVQYDDTIFPGTTFTPYSTRGGAQRKISIKYQLYQDNWWLNCQGRWVGYYPSRLFMGNQSVFSTLGDHADHIGFWGEIFDSDAVAGRTTSDMGSGRFPTEGWTWSAYMHNLLYQRDRAGDMAAFDGSLERLVTDPDMYSIDAHFKGDPAWGSYVYVGGPGAG